jgi:predicted transcriptional regulator of viral defense system
MRQKKKLNPIKIQKVLMEKQAKIFTPLDLQRVFGVSYETARKFILRYIKEGFIIKLRKGLYTLETYFPSELEIANRVYSPSYVSLEYALMFYSIIPETVYTVTSVTTKSTREFVINNISYTYSKIKKNAFTGYLGKSMDGNIVLIAEPEKAFVDYIYFVDLGKKAIYDRIDVSKLSKTKLIKYAKLFKRKSLLKLVNKIYDQSRRNKTIIY